MSNDFRPTTVRTRPLTLGLFAGLSLFPLALTGASAFWLEPHGGWSGSVPDTTFFVLLLAVITLLGVLGLCAVYASMGKYRVDEHGISYTKLWRTRRLTFDHVTKVKTHSHDIEIISRETSIPIRENCPIGYGVAPLPTLLPYLRTRLPALRAVLPGGLPYEVSPLYSKLWRAPIVIGLITSPIFIPYLLMLRVIPAFGHVVFNVIFVPALLIGPLIALNAPTRIRFEENTVVVQYRRKALRRDVAKLQRIFTRGDTLVLQFSDGQHELIVVNPNCPPSIFCAHLREAYGQSA